MYFVVVVVRHNHYNLLVNLLVIQDNKLWGTELFRYFPEYGCPTSRKPDNTPKYVLKKELTSGLSL